MLLRCFSHKAQSSICVPSLVTKINDGWKVNLDPAWNAGSIEDDAGGECSRCGPELMAAAV